MMTRKLKAEKEKTGFMRNDHCGIVHQVEPRFCDLERPANLVAVYANPMLAAVNANPMVVAVCANHII
jgi:hypothetical protein